MFAFASKKGAFVFFSGANFAYNYIYYQGNQSFRLVMSYFWIHLLIQPQLVKDW